MALLTRKLTLQILLPQEYLETHFGRRLERPDWPTIEVKRGVLYPIELVFIDPFNKYLKRFTPEEQKKSGDLQGPPPAEKLGFNLATRSGPAVTNAATMARNFGIEISPVEKRVHGRILPAPKIEYKTPDQRPTVVVPQDGQWGMAFRSGRSEQKFLRGASIDSFAIVTESSNTPRESSNAPRIVKFFDALFQNAVALGMQVRPQQIRPLAIHQRKRGETVEAAVNAAIEKAGDAYKARPNLIFWCAVSLRCCLMHRSRPAHGPPAPQDLRTGAELRLRAFQIHGREARHRVAGDASRATGEGAVRPAPHQPLHED